MAENVKTTLSNSSDLNNETETGSMTLLEDAVYPEIPINVKKIIASLYDSTSLGLQYTVTSADIAISLVFVLMVETGFLPKDSERAPIVTHNFHKENLKNYISLPPDWKSTGAYKINFILPTLPDMVVKMVGFCSEASLLINMVNVSLGEGFTTCLQPSRYVVQRSSSNPNMTFLQNLKELSKKVKDEVTVPSRSIILQYYNIIHSSLVGLPQELILKICGYLPAKSLLRLSETCALLKEISNNSKLWEIRTKTDFRRISHDTVTDWRGAYKSCYVERVSQLRRQNRMRFRTSTPYFIV